VLSFRKKFHETDTRKVGKLKPSTMKRVLKRIKQNMFRKAKSGPTKYDENCARASTQGPHFPNRERNTEAFFQA
jgi:hypothetical protein